LDSAVAKQLFERGVAAAAKRDWELATGLFEESLRHAEHRATRFNLVVANDELGRSLEVVRHAWAFLDLPGTESRPEARAQVRELMEQATRALAVLNIEALQGIAELSADGRPLQVVHGPLFYLLPGPHVLRTSEPGQPDRIVELTLEAGQAGNWPAPPARANPAMEESSPRHKSTASTQLAPIPRKALVALRGQKLATARYRAAWALGGVGATSGIASVALYAAAKLRGETLVREGWTAPGYPRDADRYGMLKNAVAPLALAGGALMAGAIILGPHAAERTSLAWGVAAIVSGAALAGLGAFWLAQGPSPLIEGTHVQSPVIQAGCLWLGASLPLLTYGSKWAIARARNRSFARETFALPSVNW
jgi:hypothetical protein